MRSVEAVPSSSLSSLSSAGCLPGGAAGRGFCRYRACLPWHSRLEHCAGFHQSPLWQWQMLQSSTFTSMPAGIIVVPAKQFGPAKKHRGNRNKYFFVVFVFFLIYFQLGVAVLL